MKCVFKKNASQDSVLIKASIYFRLTRLTPIAVVLVWGEGDGFCVELVKKARSEPESLVLIDMETT